MVQRSAQNQHRPAEPLASRHIFLDTQVYRTLGHNPANPAMVLLKKQIAAHRVVLHTTDITLREVGRQIREQVFARQRKLSEIEKDLSQWRRSAPKAAPTRAITFDADALSAELIQQFEFFVRHECKAEFHRALTVLPAVVFDTYFDRKAPFDGEGSKEFPDGFVIEVLKQWCQQQDERMHVVTADKAMTRAVSADERLLALTEIQEVLTRAAADLGTEGEAVAEAVFSSPAFDSSLEAALRAQMNEMSFVYVGDLNDGEAYEGSLLSIEEVSNWSVVGLNDRYVGLILDSRLNVRVEVQYEDIDAATYDREDDRYFGAETVSTLIDEEIDVEILVEVDRGTGIVRDAKVITREVSIHGPSQWD